MPTTPLSLTSTITTAGYIAAANNVPDANGFKINLTQMQPVVNGVPQGFFPTTGVLLGDGQVRVRASVTSSEIEYGFDEVWIYDEGSDEVFCTVKRSDGGILDYVSPYKRSVINYNIKFTTLPANTVTILADSGQSVALAALDAHITAENPHPQYELKGHDAGKLDWFAGSEAPIGWLKANGDAHSRTKYANLFKAIGTRYGTGDGMTTFNVPDVRGKFLRAWDDGRGIDVGRELGTEQDSQNKSHGHGMQGSGGHSHNASTDQQGQHGHTAWTDAQGQHQHYTNLSPIIESNQNNASLLSARGDGGYGRNLGVNTDAAGNHAHNVGIGANGQHGHNVSIGGVGDHTHTVDSSGGNEARPRNLAFLVCIKY